LPQSVLSRVRRNWYQLIPESAAGKKGKVVLEFVILKDGSLRALNLVESTQDVTLERPAWGALSGSAPFPPLPADFKGNYLHLRLSFYYNLIPKSSQESPSP
jgi:TonB family protein